jgi:prepilin-type N-terminal cleavage/methylation domain-containing protein
MSCQNQVVRRAAFTLIELLVVMAIIAIVAGLSAAAAMAVIGRQKQSNTESLLKTAFTALDQNWRAVIDSAKSEEISNTAWTLSTDALGNTDQRRARAIHIKLRLKQEFPMNFTEAQASTYYQSVLTELGLPRAPGQNPPHVADPNRPNDYSEGAVCFLLALQKKRKGVSFDLSNLNAFIADGAYQYVDASGIPRTVNLKQLVDGFGTPILFYRWPTANPEVNALNPRASDPRYRAGMFQDSLDTDGTLMANTATVPWWSGPQRPLFEQLCHSVTNAAGTGPYAYYMVPTIASAGPNHVFEIAPPRTLGVDPMMTSVPSDDIYSYRLLSVTARGD